VNLAVCRTLPRYWMKETWYRAIDPRHLSTALQSSHTSNVRSRFNPGPLLGPRDRFESLYFASDPVTAAFEAGAMLGQSWTAGGALPHPRKAFFVTLSVDVSLQAVADLTNVTLSQVPLLTSAQELTGDWDCYKVRNSSTPISEPTGTAPTQELGRQLFLAGLEGFLSISAKVPYQANLVVFPQNFRAGSRVIFRDPTNASGSPLHQIP
jgi:RES domain-containing protein